MSMVRLEGVSKSFGSVEVLRDVDLAVDQGEFLVFVGPSGSGKSTLLRIIAGLEDATKGQVIIDGKDMTFADPAERGIAMVFQSYALYPHMNVFSNMAFNLELSRFKKPEIKRRVDEAAHILHLEDLLERTPAQLSGGQRQRVAIGRAIVRHPKVFLFDEPLSNLDAALRVQMRMEIERLHHNLGTTMVYVTHDQVEAMTLADRIVVMDGGEIQQVGKPLDLYHHPVNRFVAEFIGSPRMNILSSATLGSAMPSVEAVAVGIRPECLQVISGRKKPPVGGINLLADTRTVERLGNINYGHFELAGGETLVAQMVGETSVEGGDKVILSIMPTEMHLFAEKGHTLKLPNTAAASKKNYHGGKNV